MANFHTASGAVSAYGLACGYVDQTNWTRGAVAISVSLWREHGRYHVRSHEHGGIGPIKWELTRDLAEARRMYRAQCRVAKARIDSEAWRTE